MLHHVCRQEVMVEVGDGRRNGVSIARIPSVMNGSYFHGCLKSRRAPDSLFEFGACEQIP